MTKANHYAVQAGWQVLLRDLNIRPVDVLRRAALPEDLFTRQGVSLCSEEYYQLWHALEAEAQDPLLPIRIGQALSSAFFDPPLFAAFCCPNLNTALRRLSHYKKLIAPITLHIRQTATSTTLESRWIEQRPAPPPSFIATELIFFVQLARLATRTEIQPIRVTTTQPPKEEKDFSAYFGVKVSRGPKHSISFRAEDAQRPFLSADERMWKCFDRELRERLSELDADATMSMRVHAALLELLPSGAGSLQAVAQKLRLSTRTLQRRLKRENRTFQGLLNETRRDLAQHYLKSSSMSGAEISFLLGFDDPNSFVRAFHAWTGITPEQSRRAMKAGLRRMP